MPLHPYDLGPRWHPAIVRLRLGRTAAEGAGEATRRSVGKPGWLQRFLPRLSGVSGPAAEETAAAAARTVAFASAAVAAGLGAVLPTIFLLALLEGGVISVPIALLGVLGMGVGVAILALVLARWHFRSLFAPVRLPELTGLRDKAPEGLHRDFLELARDVMRLSVPEAAEEEVRNAVRALGETLARLPEVSVAPLDTDALRGEAVRLQAEAEREPDRVTAESMHRRAMAILQRAEAHERASLLGRRSEALEAEVRAQIHALREVLSSVQAHTPAPEALTQLADAARRVATETIGLADAREELEQSVGRWGG
jgi:hypothetical protein